MTRTRTRTPRGPLGRNAQRATAVLGTAVAALLLLTGSASAHVRVFSEGAKAGSPATLRFRIPSEKADATTVRVDLALPADVASTGVPPASGWTQQEVPAPSGGAAHIVWTATAGQELKPDEHRYFEVEVGPLPTKPSIAFEVAQTYSDGTVVNWNQQPTGGKEPDFPAPVLVLDATGGGAGAAVQQLPATDRNPSAAATEGGANALPWLLWTVTGVAALGAGAVVVRRRRTARHDSSADIHLR